MLSEWHGRAVFQGEIRPERDVAARIVNGLMQNAWEYRDVQSPQSSIGDQAAAPIIETDASGISLKPMSSGLRSGRSCRHEGVAAGRPAGGTAGNGTGRYGNADGHPLRIATTRRSMIVP